MGSALFGGALIYKSIVKAEETIKENDNIPKTMKQFKQLSDIKSVVIYQYEVCPFCNKVRAFFDYNKIPYEMIEVNPIFKKELSQYSYKKVPQVIVNGEIRLLESSQIISDFAALLPIKKPAPTSKELEEEEKWREWTDDKLVHLLPPNIYRNPSEAIEAFSYIADHGNFSWYNRLISKYLGAAAMYFVSKRLRKRHNIEEGEERVELIRAVNEWLDAVDKHSGPFLGGNTPNIADLSVYGVLHSIEGLKTFHDVLKYTNAGVWYYSVRICIDDSISQKQK